jgi:FAD/FMN-containing dehydrogenase
VKGTGDIALTLKYAQANDLQAVIRCGGHSPSGTFSAEDGLVLATTWRSIVFLLMVLWPS